ncbi:MAG: hypothetical protein JW927_00255 [Deltaproteobacteria bacterium]|nr:hypothetical protein [Deltaproteobacteria bacterium]
MGKNKDIKNMSINEASEYWDEHDFEECDDIRKVEEIQFTFKKKKYIGIDIELYSLIKNKAKSLDKPEDTLIKEWLSEKAGLSA